MTKVTAKEIAQIRSQVAEDLTSMEALDLIEECEGDLEDAAMTLAIRAGQEPERGNSEWLDAVARRWRTVICQQEFRDDLLNGSVKAMMEHLKTMPTFPNDLAMPVLIYVLKKGVNNFCEPLDLVQ
ncbi:hypothetical protein [Mastigocladopsis repens]|uniref:hypothetical protein n=1 Tax=Mastigocladopsis repens TaxID=221287 RepID=UPI00037E9DFD|nr:hypothetical protein [Mastigocladopsis repens]